MIPDDWQEAKPNRLAILRARIDRARSRFVEIAQSDGFSAAMARATRKLRRKLAGKGRSLLARFGPDRCAYFTPPPTLDPYEAWQRINRENPRRRRNLDAARRAAGNTPRFSILVPVYNPPLDAFRAMIQSVLAQAVDDWELVLVDDASPNPSVRDELAYWAVKDHRIRPVHRSQNGNISAATNDAARAARGEFLVLLDHDDALHPDALAHLSVYLDDHPEVDLLYTDDDKIDLDGRRHSPQFKPDWSPELLLAFCYTAHLTAVRRELYHRAGGMRLGFEGSQDHDFWLRASEVAREVGHIPQILYHWRIVPGSTALSGHCKPASFEAGRLAVEQAFHRRGIADCTVEQPDWALRAGCAIFRPIMPDVGPSAAILIPSRNQGARLKVAVDSLAKTTYQNYRIYILDNESDDPGTLEYLAAQPHRVLRIPNPEGRFSFAAINNTAASMVDEDLLVFLNDDTEVIEPRWLSQMVGWSRLEGVGAVGARLLFPDRRVQHAGIVQGIPEGVAGHAFKSVPWWDPGHLNQSRVTRDVAAVTAACMLTPRKLFLEMGGFDEARFAVAYNDVDYGHRLRDAGHRVVYCAEAELYHHEGASRGKSGDPREMAAYRRIHGRRVDPYFSPHLDPESEEFHPRPTVVPVGRRHGPVPMLAVTHNLNWEGAPRIELEIVRRLQATGRVKVEVLSPLDGPLRSEYEELGIPIRVEPDLAGITVGEPRMDLYREQTARLGGWIAERGFEVVHANTLRTFWAIEAARRAGIASVWSVHESEPWPSSFDDLPTDLAAAALGCLANPYRVIFSAVSSLQVWKALDTSRNFGLIRYAHDVPKLVQQFQSVDRDEARRGLGIGEDEVCVLLMGTVCERKGQHDLIRAFAALPEEVARRMRCFVVGARESIPYSRRMVAMAAGLPEGRRDRFTIVPETGDTLGFWRAADVFCCSSRVESYPLVTMEAMAAGLPIVTTPVFGIAEQVHPDVNARIYRPGDIAAMAGHLTDLVRDAELRRSMAERSPQVLGSLADDARMNDLYLRVILAAAESAPMFPASEGAGQGPGARGRKWFADAASRRSQRTGARSRSGYPA